MNDLKKTCPKCKRELLLEEFYISKKTGRPYSPCKECSRKARKEYYYSEKGQEAQRRYWESGGREKHAEYQRAYRQTERGKEVFRRYETSEKGKAKNKRYRQSQKGKATKGKAYARRMQDPTYRKRMRAYWRKANKKQSAKKRWKKYIKSPKGHKAKLRKDRKYKRSQKGLEAARRSNTKRRRLIMGADCTLTLQEWEQIQKKQNHRCYYCGEKMDHPTQDHVIPVSRGGEHTKDNIVAACLPCNLKKGDKLLNEIPAQYFKQT